MQIAHVALPATSTASIGHFPAIDSGKLFGADAPVAANAQTASSVAVTAGQAGATRQGVAELGSARERNSPSDLTKLYAPTQGKQGAALLHELHLIARRGHVDRGYAQARDELFSDVADTDGDDRIEDLFTGESRGPINGRKNAFDQGFNTEHTWPQSKGARGVAQSDLHHLHPGDIRTNERRGSHPYGDVAQVEWSTGEGAAQAKLGADALGKTVFEPHDPVKGDIARGLLYFYTRYYESRPADFTTENFRHEVETLLRWNAADPVDDRERARNDAIHKVQGNRNPYVDDPSFVDRVGFGKLDIR